MSDPDIGAQYLGEGRCRFTVWAPRAEKVEVRLIFPAERRVPLASDERGFWSAVLDHVRPGTGYYYLLDDDKQRPDPASHYQPQGVHRFSEVVDHELFPWNDEDWKGISLENMVMYEIHAGTFTSRGTLPAVIPRLEQLRDLGINTLSVMPVAQFPGERNWGYDGVYPFAVQNSYGGPEGLKALVDACHNKGMAVVLDVVYNHLGPEGNYLHDYGPYFTSKYKTPWGDAVNFDDAHSDGVRRFFIQNALHWFRRYHIDGLRLDAVHAITDMSARPFLKELAAKVGRFNLDQEKKVILIAESDLNDPKIIRPPEKQGFGLDGQWCDDFHHALHALLTGEKDGYYADFGTVGQLAKSFREGYVLTGSYSVFRRRSHGDSARDCSAAQFVVFTQNHDQVGNRMSGERLSSLVPFEALKLAAGILICSPYVPLLFMGQEYGETSPFLYFVSHGDRELVEAVRRGRRREFQGFIDESECPDPQSEETFARSRLNWDLRCRGSHKVMLEYYRNLLHLRKKTPVLADLNNQKLRTREYEDKKILVVLRGESPNRIALLMNFSSARQRTDRAFPPGFWRKKWDSSEKQWSGTGSVLPEVISGEIEMEIPAWSFSVFESEEPA